MSQTPIAFTVKAGSKLKSKFCFAWKFLFPFYHKVNINFCIKNEWEAEAFKKCYIFYVYIAKNM